MDIQQLQKDVFAFVRQHPQRRFHKGEIALGVAQGRLASERLTDSVDVEADAIHCVLKLHRLRTWPGIMFSRSTK